MDLPALSAQVCDHIQKCIDRRTMSFQCSSSRLLLIHMTDNSGNYDLLYVNIVHLIPLQN